MRRRRIDWAMAGRVVSVAAPLIAYPVALASFSQGFGRSFQPLTIQPAMAFLAIILLTGLYGFYALKLVGEGISERRRDVWPGGAVIVFGIIYGPPIVWLALQTAAWTAVVPLVHVVVAGRGHRLWAFLQHGVTCFAVAVFLVSFGTNPPLGWPLAVAMMQAAFLCLIEWKVRPTFVTNPPLRVAA